MEIGHFGCFSSQIIGSNLITGVSQINITRGPPIVKQPKVTLRVGMPGLEYLVYSTPPQVFKVILRHTDKIKCPVLCL